VSRTRNVTFEIHISYRNSVEIEFPKLQEVVEEARVSSELCRAFFKVKGRASVHIDYCIGTTYQLPEDEIQFFTYLLTYQSPRLRARCHWAGRRLSRRLRRLSRVCGGVRGCHE